MGQKSEEVVVDPEELASDRQGAGVEGFLELLVLLPALGCLDGHGTGLEPQPF